MRAIFKLIWVRRLNGKPSVPYNRRLPVLVRSHPIDYNAGLSLPEAVSNAFRGKSDLSQALSCVDSQVACCGTFGLDFGMRISILKQRFMRLEREKDIIALQGKNWREKWALRTQAEERDPWILRLKLLKYFFVLVPTFTFSCWLAYQLSPHFQTLVAIGIGIMLGLPIDMLLYSLFIVPRIRRALDSNI